MLPATWQHGRVGQPDSQAFLTPTARTDSENSSPRRFAVGRRSTERGWEPPRRRDVPGWLRVTGEGRPLAPAGSASEPWWDGEGESWPRCSTGCAGCATARSISRGSDVRCSRDHWGLNLVTLNSAIPATRQPAMVNVRFSSVLTSKSEFDLRASSRGRAGGARCNSTRFPRWTRFSSRSKSRIFSHLYKWTIELAYQLRREERLVKCCHRLNTKETVASKVFSELWYFEFLEFPVDSVEIGRPTLEWELIKWRLRFRY